MLLTLTLLSAFPIVSHQDEAEAAYTPATSTVTITSASTDASIDITPTSANGTFVSTTSAEEVAFSVTTDNLTGYTLAMTSRSGDTTGKLTNASYTDTLDTITSPVNETTFANDTTGTYTNKWGIKSSKYNTSTSTWDPLASGNYIPAPKTSDVVLDTTSSPNSTPIQYRVGIGAKVDYTKAAGTYTNTFILQAVARQISYAINYIDNSGDPDLGNMPASEGQANITASAFTVSSTVPTRGRYTFLGWCDGALTNNGGSCSGTIYQAGDTYNFASLSTTSTNTANLYAVWKLYFQNATNSDCGKVMFDNRGSAAYKDIAYTTAQIGSLCYMTRNLDLPGGTTITNANSNIIAASYTLPASSTTGFDDDDKAFVYNSNIYSCDDTNPCYSYYSYVAAAAGTNPAYEEATSDICPRGWRLPAELELTKLKDTYATSAALVSSPFAAVYDGRYDYGEFYDGDRGFYRASTAGGTNAHGPASWTMAFSDGSTVGMHNYDKKSGYGVRCVKKDYMQDFTSANATSMTAGETRMLADKRDQRLYPVTKINNQIWMTRNLDLPGGTTITNVDSNITAASYTLPASSTTGFNDHSKAFVYNSNTTVCGDDTNPTPCYSYYSYVAAVAGLNPSTGNAASDICPKNWRLPTDANFSTLISTYTTAAALMATPFNGVYTGRYDSSVFYPVNNGANGRNAYYRSSTAYSSTAASTLNFGTISPTAPAIQNYGKTSGYAVRCVAK